MLALNNKEMKLFAFALCPGGNEHERNVAAAKLFASLRERGIRIEDLAPPRPQPRPIVAWTYTWGTGAATTSW
jgi:hypothetical protein